MPENTPEPCEPDYTPMQVDWSGLVVVLAILLFFGAIGGLLAFTLASLP